MMRSIVVLVLGLLAAAGVAEQVTPAALRLLVEYPGSEPGVALAWKNLTQVPLTLEYSGTPITRVTTVDGAEVPMTALIDAMLVKATVAPGGEKRIAIDPARFYDMTPGEAYLVTVACQVLQADSGIGYTFPYVTPTAQQAFSSGWTPVEGRGVEVRLNLALNPKDGRGEARVAFRNAGDIKAEVYDRAMLTAKVWRAGTPVAPSSSVKVRMEPLRAARLPRFTTLDLPLEQFNDHTPPPVGRVAVWLGHQQYVLEPGVRYRIDAATSLPGEGGKPVEVKLRPVEVYLPAEAAQPAEKSPVTVSFQYQNGGVTVFFTNALEHPLTFTGDVISAADRFGGMPQSTTSARPPGLWPRTPVPARGEASFAFMPHQFMLAPGEWYRMTGAWALRDEVTKREYAVSATFPYVAPSPNPIFAGNWQPVAGRPGLEVRLFGALCPAARPTDPNIKWQPAAWIAYRNMGKGAVPVFDFPTLSVKVQTSDGKEVPGMHFEQTGIPNIELLSLSPGATLTLPALTHELYLEPQFVPENVRHTLCFENLLFPLAPDLYRVEGTILLPDGEKPLQTFVGTIRIDLF